MAEVVSGVPIWREGPAFGMGSGVKIIIGVLRQFAEKRIYLFKTLAIKIVDFYQSCQNTATLVNPKFHRPAWVLRLLLLFVGHATFGQTHSFNHYSIPEGLPSLEVYDVYQDHHGFIWFATDNGVVRYDGNQMETFQVNEGLTDPVVFGITEDAKGRIWFRTFSGRVCYYHNKSIHPYRFNDALFQLCKNSYLFAVYPDANDDLWFSTNFAIGKIDFRGKIEKEGIELHHLTLKEIENQFLVGYMGPLEEIDHVDAHGNLFPLHLTDKVHKRPINCTVSWKGEEYFSVGATIFKIGKTSVDPVLIGKDQIISLSKDLDDNLWIGYFQNGATRYRSFTDASPFQFPFLNSKSVTRVLQDAQKGYWASTLEDGVYYVPEFTFLNHPIANQTKIRTVFAREGHTVIGDDLGMISVLDRSGNLVSQKKIEGRSILSVLIDSKKNIWAATNNNTFLLDLQLNTKEILPYSFSCLTQDDRGHIWGIGGFYTMRLNSKGKVTFELMSGSARFISFTKTNVYLYGRLGLEVFNRSFDEQKVPKAFDNLKISKVTTLDDPFILITTLGSGFYVVNRNDWSYKHYDSKNNFIADNIYAALVVNSTLWLGTEKGVAITTIQSLLRGTPSLQLYTQRNGLFSNRVSQLSYTAPDVWAYYDDGFSSVPASLPKDNQEVPRFYLKEILINNQVDSIENLSNLNFDQNNIQINFGFSDFKNQNILIRSRLSTASNWSYDTERSVRFFSLSPADYLFELEYSVDNLHWISAMRRPFSISPQWWKNWRIQSASLMLLGIFGFVYYRRRIKVLREKQDLLKIINEQQQKLIRAELETLESERSRIAKDLHDSIGTNLAAIKLFLSGFFKLSNEPNAAIIETTLQETIQGTKDIIANLAPSDLERFGLVEAIKIYSHRMQDQFNIALELISMGQEVNKPEINIHLFRVLQELLTNSLKYSGAKKITITINFTSDELMITYKDDGVGFNFNSIKKGNGLLNVQSRIQILEGTIKFDSGSQGVMYYMEVPLKVNQS